jgi:hypothetical protein
MSLKELAKFGLPGPRHTFNEVYREFFSSESTFIACVRAFHDSGQLPERDDQAYRLSDTYRLPSLVSRAIRIRISERFDASPAFALDVFPAELDDAWWDPILALIAGRDAVKTAHDVPGIRDATTGQLLRALPPAEHAVEVERIIAAVIDEEGKLAQSLPSDKDWWRERLRAHGMLVVGLRESGRVTLARLCAYHLSAASLLAEKRLGMTRRDLRVLVGIGRRHLTLRVGAAPVEETEFLLTEASFSRAARAYDRALDALEAMLPDYNAAALPELRLDASDVRNFVDHLRQSGLEDWALQLVAEIWDIDVLWEMSDDQRIAMVF